MGIFELAAQLGKALKEDKRLIALEAARKVYEEDAEVAQLMTEYEVQQQAIQYEAVKEDRDPELLKTIQERIDTIYDKITATESYKALEAAQNDVNELMTLVNSTITFNITGEQPSGCSHDCSKCGGCH